jgi:hypothetical protein
VYDFDLLVIGSGPGVRSQLSRNRVAILTGTAHFASPNSIEVAGTIDYLVDAVFNYPTLAESYKVAALDATNKMRQVARFGD